MMKNVSKYFPKSPKMTNVLSKDIYSHREEKKPDNVHILVDGIKEMKPYSFFKRTNT